MSNFKDNIASVRYNPGLMQQMVLDELASQLEGQGDFDIPDASLPFPALLETAVLTASTAMSEGESILRRLYPSMALTVDEVYAHMSDTDYLNRFSVPVTSDKFEMFLLKDEIISAVVPLNDGSGISKMRIPRYSRVLVGGIPFMLLYPIDIRLMAHGDLQIVYDNADISPLLTLNTNVVPYVERNIEGNTYIVLQMSMSQVTMDSYTEVLNESSPFNATYSFTDAYYYTRAWLSDGNGGWTEVKTTHSDQVYNPAELTVVLKVNGNQIQAKIPLVYNTSGLATGSIRLDIYTTRGNIDVDLGDYNASDFEVNFDNTTDDDQFTAPIYALSTVIVLNPTRVSGGSGGITFETLRNRVINNSVGPIQLPITNAQVNTVFNTYGYNLVTNVDNLTDLQFLATRQVTPPAQTSSNPIKSVSSAGTLFALQQLSMETIAASKHVADNGDRVTILPSMLYRYSDNGLVKMLTDSEIDYINAADPEEKALLVAENRYLYTPLHYVLDATANNFEVRPYYLDNPVINGKQFVGSNNTSQLNASVNTYSISRIDGGYRVKVELKSGEAFKAVLDSSIILQMAYVPDTELSYAAANGVFIGINPETGERQYQFDILTNYDLNDDGALFTTNFSMYDQHQTQFATDLTNNFLVSIIITGYESPSYVASNMDSNVARYLVPQPMMVINQELLNITLGYDLSTMWSRARTILSEMSFETYPEDVLAVYDENVYERGPDDQVIVSLNPDNTVNYHKLHSKGDPVLVNGQPVIRHHKGDIIYDAFGQPVLKDPRKVWRDFTMLFVDGIYYFATEANSVAYSKEIPMILVRWLLEDLANIQKRLMGRAEVFMYPTNTFGNAAAIVKENIESTIRIDQKLSVTYYMDRNHYNNTAARDKLTETTKQVIAAALAEQTVSRSELTRKLMLAVGDDAIAVDVSGLGGEDYSVITLKDASVRLNIANKLTVQANSELIIENDIDVQYKLHSTK